MGVNHLKLYLQSGEDALPTPPTVAAQGLPSQPHWPKPLHGRAQPMSCVPCPFERGSSGQWPPGPREQTLKGRGSWNWHLGYLGLCRSGCLPSVREGGGGGGRVQLWDSCLSCGGDVTVLTDTMPHLCPAPQSLCPVSPGMGQGLLTSGRRPGMRAKGHQTTCPERQA